MKEIEMFGVSMTRYVRVSGVERVRIDLPKGAHALDLTTDEMATLAQKLAKFAGQGQSK